MDKAEDREECLHCKLMQVIEEHIAAHSEIAASEVTDRIVEALADFILAAGSAEERTKLIGYALEHLGGVLSEDSAAETRH